MTERGVPFHCPFCGEGDLWPHEASHGSWECRSCLRAFSLKMLGLVRPGLDRLDHQGGLVHQRADREES